MGKKRRLTGLKIDEVSLVDHPANKRKFMFAKKDDEGEAEESSDLQFYKGNTDIIIKSDGTVEGTSVSINGRTIEGILDFSFGYYATPGLDMSEQKVQARYTIMSKGRTQAGFRTTSTFTLSKAEWNTKYVNSLPDSSFLWVEKGGKAVDGMTKPLSLRHLPYKDKLGKLDIAHVKAASAAIGGARTGKPMNVPAVAKSKLKSAMKTLGIGQFKKIAEKDVELIKQFNEEADVSLISESKGTELAKVSEVLAEYRKAAPADVREAMDSLFGIALTGTVDENDLILSDDVSKEEDEAAADLVELEEKKMAEQEENAPEIDVKALAQEVADAAAEKVLTALKEEKLAEDEAETKATEEATARQTEIDAAVQADRDKRETEESSDKDEDKDLTDEEATELMTDALVTALNGESKE